MSGWTLEGHFPFETPFIRRQIKLDLGRWNNLDGWAYILWPGVVAEGLMLKSRESRCVAIKSSKIPGNALWPFRDIYIFLIRFLVTDYCVTYRSPWNFSVLFLNFMLGTSCIVTYALQELQEINSSPLTINGWNMLELLSFVGWPFLRGELLVFGESILMSVWFFPTFCEATFLPGGLVATCWFSLRRRVRFFVEGNNLEDDGQILPLSPQKIKLFD